MTCKECQQAMLIYDLLDDQERWKMEQHKSQCVSCEKSWSETVMTNSVIREIAQHKIKIPNAEALTDRIMTLIIHEKKQKITNPWTEKIFFGAFTRYALSGISICLVILFATEIVNSSFTEKPKGPVAGLQVILSSQDFKKSFTTARTDKKLLLNRCKSGDNGIDIACLKLKMKF